MGKKKKMKKPDSLFLRGVLIVFLCAVGFGVFGQFRAYEAVKEEQAIIAAEIAEEEKKQQEFQEKKEYYNSDSYIEQIAREQLGMIKPNEILYVNRGE